jgi:DNA end-binding protein Ku
MRPVWSGAVSFGLVTIPIKVLPAVEDKSISFHQIHTTDGSRIRYRKICELDEQVLSQDQISRAYEVSKDHLVQISDAELDEMPLPTAKAVDVQAFVPAERIDPIRYGRPYYLQADGAVAAKPYVLLRRALERSDKIAIVKFAWHNRERLGALRVVGDTIVLQALHWPDEVRSAEGIAPKTVEVSDAEVDEALALAEAIGSTDISTYRDKYREAVEAVIEAKAEGRQPPEMEAMPAPAGQVVDLMSALQDSVRAAKKSRGENLEAEVSDISGRQKPAQKKSTANKDRGPAKPRKRRAS